MPPPSARCPCRTAASARPETAGMIDPEARPLGRSASPYLNRLHRPPLAASLPDAQLAPYSAAQVQFAMRAWTMRAEEEYRSAAIFAELLPVLVGLPAPFELLGALTGVITD